MKQIFFILLSFILPLCPMEGSKIARILAHIQRSQSFIPSNFKAPSAAALKVLQEGQILAEGETPAHMIERVLATVSAIEEEHTEWRADMLEPRLKFIQSLGKLMDERKVVMSTPILTNCGRFVKRPLSACSMPPVDLKSDWQTIKTTVNSYHQDGMGTGFNLSDLENPLAMLNFLNEVAYEGAQHNNEQRPVGNMAILDVDSPHIEKFIQAKVGADLGKWKFNISVNISEAFIQAALEDKPFTLKDGRIVSAKKLLDQMAHAAHQCGDPGIISLERLNKDNPTPHVALYQTTAPCAEVGLAPGETCVFGYINVGEFVSAEKNPTIEYDQLAQASRHMTRALDNILEYSILHYSNPASAQIMNAKRKIGIGICGFADLLSKLDIPYTDPQAQALLQEILTTINFHAKSYSVQLAQARGSFGAIAGSKYMDEAFLNEKFGPLGTKNISERDWQALARTIATSHQLRNATTTSLPPTGRSACVIDASASIEPHFSFKKPDGSVYRILADRMKHNSLGTDSRAMKEILETGCCPDELPYKKSFLTATEISPHDHMAMSLAAQRAIDESVSKTINVPATTTPEEIKAMYLHALQAGTKGMTVYRDGSTTLQPLDLSKKKTIFLNDPLIAQLVHQAQLDGIEKLSVGGAIIDQDKLLMLKRAPNDFMPNIFELPGGGLEGNETVLEALEREVKEETNCSIERINDYIGHIDFPSANGKLTRRFNFLVTPKKPFNLQLSEHADYAWIDPHKVPNLPITQKTLGVISLIAQKK